MSHQRYFKVTPKGRAPKVTHEWPADIPWHLRHATALVLLPVAAGVLWAAHQVGEAGFAAVAMAAVWLGTWCGGRSVR